MSQNIIEIKNVSKTYGDNTVLKNLSLNIRKNEFLTLLGPSGCGKTTTLKILAGFESGDSGKVLFNGEDISNLPPYKRQLNTVFQKYALFPHMNVYENIAFGLKIKKVSKNEIDKKVSEMLKLVALEGFEKRAIDSLSGGQQQRVAIARALVNEPKVLLLDEPLGALDLKLRKEMQSELKRIQQRLGITFIFVTHDQEEALSISDRIVLMNQGIVQQFDIPQNLYLEPANLFVAKFMGNPIINIYEMNKEGNVLVGDDFSIDLGLLNESRIKQSFNEDKYVVGIRPEYFILSDTPLFKGKIETAELIGKDCILNFKINNKFSKAITDINEGICENDEVGFDIDYNGIYIFKEDGTRVY